MGGIQAGKEDKIIPLPVRFIKNHELSQIQAGYKNKEIKESVLDNHQSRMHPITLEITMEKKNSKRIKKSINRKNERTTLCLTQKRSRRREKNIK